MKTKISINVLWYVMISSRLLFWAVAYFIVLPKGSLSTIPYVDYILTTLAFGLAAASSYYYLYGNTNEELVAYSIKILARGRDQETSPNATHGYQAKMTFTWSLSQWLSVLGIIAAQILLPLNYVHGFCGLSLILIMWHRPQSV